MRVVYIDSTDVENHPERYNSAFHRSSEHPLFKAELESPYDDHATDYGKWIDLITESQGMAQNNINCIQIDRDCVKLMLEYGTTSILTGKISKHVMEEIYESQIWTQVSKYLPIERGEKEVFVRSDEVSAKDGVFQDRPVRSCQDFLIHLMTSKRMMGSFRRFLGLSDSYFNIYLLPYDRDMDTSREFRVFVAPCTAVNDLRISGISQYRWWQEFLVALGSLELHNRIGSEAERILEEIKSSPLASTLCQGFVFDILIREKNFQGVLIELNGFGGTRGAGSALFHWVRDHHLLYNEKEDEDSNDYELRLCCQRK